MGHFGELCYQLTKLRTAVCINHPAFYHDHIHINGTNGGLGQKITPPQDRKDFSCRDPIVRLKSKQNYHTVTPDITFMFMSVSPVYN